jgi:hypothetical protein
MYIQNVHLKLYLYFSDKLLSKHTGILEIFVSRWFSNWHALLEADHSYFNTKLFHKLTELQQVMTRYNK